MLTLKWFRLFSFLTATILILAQCTEKTSSQYVEDGRISTQNAQYDEALEAFKRAVEINPKNPDAHYGLGGIHNQKGNYPSAEKAFLATLELDPTFVDAYYSLGYTYEGMDKKEKAEKYFTKYKTLKEKFTRLLEKEKIKP